jgi:hypothetical protein
MLTHTDKNNILSEFPNIKLSYENITYKKVYNFDYIVAIPEGKKCFAWFTSINNKMVCLIMDLTINKQIADIKITNACFSDELAYGTILYGTVFYNLGNPFFSIEDIFSYKGDDVERMCWGEKLLKINNMLKKDLKQLSYNNSFIVFGLPPMYKTNEELEMKLKNINYPIETVQFKLFNKVNTLLYMKYNDYINYVEIKQTNNKIEVQEIINVKEKTIINVKEKDKYNINVKEKVYDKNSSKINIKREIVFLIRPDIQDDIYYLHCLNDELIEEQCGIAHIQDYNASVMMNKLFRIIKENNNLDALEESDDEDEFENNNIDKFVHLNKSYKMICQFNHKFKKWYPIKLANENADIIQLNELKSIYKMYEQNKKR